MDRTFPLALRTLICNFLICDQPHDQREVTDKTRRGKADARLLLLPLLLARASSLGEYFPRVSTCLVNSPTKPRDIAQHWHQRPVANSRGCELSAWLKRRDFYAAGIYSSTVCKVVARNLRLIDSTRRIRDDLCKLLQSPLVTGGYYRYAYSALNVELYVYAVYLLFVSVVSLRRSRTIRAVQNRRNNRSRSGATLSSLLGFLSPRTDRVYIFNFDHLLAYSLRMKLTTGYAFNFASC